MTPLDKTLKRAIKIKGLDFVLTLTPRSLKVTRKGRQRGVELVWESLVSGESALAVALQASVGQFEFDKVTSARPMPLPKKSKSTSKKAGDTRRRRSGVLRRYTR
jgi:hypothetical protein